jgi:hypothetical protein
MCCGLAVVVACGQRADGFVEGWREINRQACQVNAHRGGCDCYLVPGEGGDVFCALGEDDHQDRGETVAGMERLLVCDLFATIWLEQAAIVGAHKPVLDCGRIVAV